MAYILFFGGGGALNGRRGAIRVIPYEIIRLFLPAFDVHYHRAHRRSQLNVTISSRFRANQSLSHFVTANLSLFSKSVHAKIKMAMKWEGMTLGYFILKLQPSNENFFKEFFTEIRTFGAGNSLDFGQGMFHSEIKNVM